MFIAILSVCLQWYKPQLITEKLFHFAKVNSHLRKIFWKCKIFFYQWKYFRTRNCNFFTFTDSRATVFVWSRSM